jgi:nucleoside-diphosphate-sugar epimerase
MISEKRVLITGASGFIATYLARRLAAAGWSVYGVDRPGASPRAPYAALHRAALGESVADFLAQTRPAAIIHTALDPRPNTLELNADGTTRWLREGQAAGATTQILLSSLSAEQNALSEYGRGKWALEQEFGRAGEVTVRLGVVVGPGGMFARLVDSARRAPVIPLLGGGQQLLYVLGIERLTEILRDILATDAEGLRGRSWNLPQPEPVTLREMMRAIVRAYGLARVSLPLPAEPLLWGTLLFEKQTLIRLPITSTNIRGLIQAGTRRFQSDYARFGYPAQPLAELVTAARDAR